MNTLPGITHGTHPAYRNGIPTLLFFIVFTCTAAAQPTLEFSGYVLDVPTYQRLPDYSEAFGSLAPQLPADRDMAVNLTRLRLRPTLRLWEGASIALEHEVTMNVSTQRMLFGELPDITNRQVVDLRWHPAQEEHLQLQHFVDRLYFRQNFLWGSLVVGRQRISWGTGRIWNPTDLFNPINPVSFDKIEKDGADALSFKYYFGSFTDLQLVFNPRLARGQPEGAAKAPDSSNYGARFRSNVAEFDLSVMGGCFDRRTVIGGDFAGNLLEAGVRGEMIYAAESGKRDAFVRFVLGADYQFTSRLYTVVEYLHNGEGEADRDDYELFRLFEGEILNLGTDYLYVGGSYLLHPLVTATFGTTLGFGDGSGFATAAATWSTSDNSSLTAGLLLPFGAARDEYWYYPASAYLKGDFYF
ncbi:MAG: hypothetical protein RRA94_02755 [Bacteroidota bacterium]|nr:hypothetical protein [Bacteroidota bacterium]